MKEFKIRASACGQIMSNAKGNITKLQLEELDKLKAKDKVTPKQQETINKLEWKRDHPQVSTTTKSYLDEWMKEQLYSRRNSFGNKFTEKGIEVEDAAIEYLTESYPDYFMLEKNEQYFENDFMCGTPDVILPDHIIDIKSSWSCFTFPLFEEEVSNAMYYFQAQVYMDLVGRDNYKLIYVLMDTPDHLIEKDLRAENYGKKMEDQIEFADFRQNYVYNDIDSKYRIKVFDIERNDSDIQRIKDKVLECRSHIKELKKKL